MSKAKHAGLFEDAWIALYEEAINYFTEFEKGHALSKIGKLNRKRLKKLFKLLQKGY